LKPGIEPRAAHETTRIYFVLFRVLRVVTGFVRRSLLLLGAFKDIQAIASLVDVSLHEFPAFSRDAVYGRLRRGVA
jgi:hypothetical protein